MPENDFIADDYARIGSAAIQKWPGSHEVKRSLRINIIAGCFAMIWAACVFGSPLPLFMEAVGASGLMIGMIGVVNQLAMACQVPGALMVERMPRRKPFWAVTALLHRMLWFVPALIPLLLADHPQLHPWILLTVIAASAVLGNAATAAWQSWMADLVPARGGGRFWGVRQSFLTAASMIGVYGAGWLLDLWSGPGNGDSLAAFGALFAIAAVIGTTDIIIHLWVCEPPVAPLPQAMPLMKRLLDPLRETSFRRLTVAMGLWYFSVGLIGSFQFVYLKRDVGFNYSMVAQLSLLAAISSTVSGFVFGTLMDRIGSKTLAVLLVMAAPVAALAWFFIAPVCKVVAAGGLEVPQPMLVLGAMMLIGGSLYAGVVLCQMRLTAQASKPEGRTMAMAVHWTVVGLSGAFGPLIGGVVMDYIDHHPLGFALPSGVPTSFFHVLLVGHIISAWALVAPVMAGVVVPGREIPVSSALRRALVMNPLQAVRNFHHISSLASTPGSVERASMVRSLGRSRSQLAVGDLIEHLEDPSLDVREEAIASLGEIGTREAVAVLAERLADPAYPLRAQAARALRFCADDSCAGALLSGLLSGDPTTIRECVRAIGQGKISTACQPLVSLLASTEDSATAAHCATALGNLGERAALPVIVMRLEAGPAAWCREAMACAVGNLLGPKDGFYRALKKEKDATGAGFEELAGRLRKSLARKLGKLSAADRATALDAAQKAFAAGGFAVAADALCGITPPDGRKLAAVLRRQADNRTGCLLLLVAVCMRWEQTP